MAQSATESGKYVGAAALFVGCALTAQGTNYKEVDVAAAVTTTPLGIAAQTGVQNDNVGYYMPGQTVKAVASAAIAIGAFVTATTAGQMVTVVKSATPTANAEWAWGYALSAAANAGEVFEMYFWPMMYDWT